MKARFAIAAALLAASAWAQPFQVIDDTHNQHIRGNKSLEPVTFSSLSTTQHDGTIHPCSDCAAGNPCVGGGTGAFATWITDHWVCGGVPPTATPASTPTPQPTATPLPTDTPLINILYSGKLNITGAVAISASATPAAGDRIIDCTSGSSADQTYTLPAATGTGRIIDVFKVDSGTKACIISRAGSDAINSGTIRTLAVQWDHDTCRDYASAVWVCVGSGL